MTAEQVHEIGLAFAKKAWSGHEVLVTTHTDAAHLHNYFVINSVHYENGKTEELKATTASIYRISRRSIWKRRCGKW